MSGERPCWLWTAIVVVGLLVVPAPVWSDDVPLQRTPAGLAARVADAMDTVREVGPVLGVSAGGIADGSRCSGVRDDVLGGDEERLTRCIEALSAIYAALTDGADVDARTAAARAYVASEVADAAFRVTSARAAARAGQAGQLAPDGGVPAQILVLADHRTLRVRPLQALRPRRKWALVMGGLTAAERDAVRDTVVPRIGPHGLVVPEGSLVAPLDYGTRSAPTGVDRKAALAVARRMEAEIREREGASPVAGVQVRLAEPLTANDLGRIVASFQPARVAPAAEAIVELPIADLRGSLDDARERIASLACPQTPAAERAGLAAADGATAATILAAVYPSIDMRREVDGRLYEMPAASAPVVRLPYVLALPEGFGPETPLVLLVHGHGGDATKFLAQHAGPLLARGLAAVAVEIPDHGARGSREKEFLGVRDPSRLRVNVRQSLLDILALLRVAEDCGFVLPGGERYVPREVRYMGYSFGGMLGVAVRSLVPTLGRAVFVAAGGDLAGWLHLYSAAELSEAVATCLGGPEHGRNCRSERGCAPPGVCWVDPYLAWMASSIDMPFGLVLADAEPLGTARVRTGQASHAPLLLITGGTDAVLYPLLQARLADAYDLRGEHPAPMRGPGSRRRHWPALGHDLIDDEEVRTAAYDFLAAGRRPGPASP